MLEDYAMKNIEFYPPSFPLFDIRKIFINKDWKKPESKEIVKAKVISLRNFIESGQKGRDIVNDFFEKSLFEFNIDSVLNYQVFYDAYLEYKKKNTGEIEFKSILERIYKIVNNVLDNIDKNSISEVPDEDIEFIVQFLDCIDIAFTRRSK